MAVDFTMIRFTSDMDIAIMIRFSTDRTGLLISGITGIPTDLAEAISPITTITSIASQPV